VKATNWAKAVYVSVYLTVVSIIAVYAVWRLIEGGLNVGYIGAVLANGPIVLLVGWLLLLRPTARTSPHLTPVLVLALVGAGLGVTALLMGSPSSLEACVLALVGLAGFQAYDRWYSIFGRDAAAAVAVGRTLPDFELEDAVGASVSSAEFRGKPVLLLFYRGNWCPLCMAQIKEIAGQYQELERRGVTVALVSPQPQGHTARLAAKLDVPFRFLVDRQGAVAEKLGIAAPGGLPFGMQIFGYDSDTVLPTVIIADAEGKIILSDQTDNYRIRPEPATFLAALDGAA